MGRNVHWVPVKQLAVLSLRGSYGRESIVRDDWKKVFNDDELDKVISRMLKIESSDTLTHSA